MRTVISCRWDTGGDGHRRFMAKRRVGAEPLFLGLFWSAIFVVPHVSLGVCEVVVEGKRGSFMSVTLYCVHDNIVPHIATQCYAVCFDVILSQG